MERFFLEVMPNGDAFVVPVDKREEWIDWRNQFAVDTLMKAVDPAEENKYNCETPHYARKISKPKLSSVEFYLDDAWERRLRVL